MQRGVSILAVAAVIFVVLLIAVAALTCVVDTKSAANEGGATAALRALSSAEADFAKANGHFAESLKDLRAGHADLGDSVLSGLAEGGSPTNFTKYGYEFKYVANKVTFHITADPVTRGKTGTRSFYVDESAIIRANATTSATATDNPI